MKRKNIIQTLFGAGMLVSLGTFGLMQTTLPPVQTQRLVKATGNIP